MNCTRQLFVRAFMCDRKTKNVRQTAITRRRRRRRSGLTNHVQHNDRKMSDAFRERNYL